jgi:hypothetical protein
MQNEGYVNFLSRTSLSIEFTYLTTSFEVNIENACTSIHMNPQTLVGRMHMRIGIIDDPLTYQTYQYYKLSRAVDSLYTFPEPKLHHLMSELQSNFLRIDSRISRKMGVS